MAQPLRMNAVISSGAFLLTIMSSFAADGGPSTASDALLQALGASSETHDARAQPVSGTAPSVSGSPAMVVVKLTNPVSRQLFADWTAQPQNSPGMGVEMNQWVQFFLTDKFESFAHLWGAMEDRVPAGMLASVRSAYLYSLYQMNVPQMFFDEWMQSARASSFISHRSSSAMEEAIGKEFDTWFLKSEIQISAEQEALIQRIGSARSPVFLTLNAATYRRKGLAALPVLEKLSVNSPFRPWLAQTVAVAQAKKGDLAGAGRTLKLFYEPWLLVSKDPRKLATHYMEIARLLYQAGSLEGAIAYYEKVPNGIPEYLTAREELAWCWLRLGQTEKLRGNLESLTSKALDDHFQPEAYLVRAVSNLKLCYYDQVEKDFGAFIRVNSEWAKKIDGAVKSAEPPVPRSMDIYGEAAVVGLREREVELNTLRTLSERSISAVIPAVGPQKHWSAGMQRIALAIENAKKRKSDEFRRQWKNDRITLNEAIRKMQFVKVELLSQVSEMTAMNEGKLDRVGTSASSAVSTAPLVTKEKKEQLAKEGDVVFPFDGVMWPDEMFHLKSISKGRCAGQ